MKKEVCILCRSNFSTDEIDKVLTVLKKAGISPGNITLRNESSGLVYPEQLNAIGANIIIVLTDVRIDIPILVAANLAYVWSLSAAGKHLVFVATTEEAASGSLAFLLPTIRLGEESWREKLLRALTIL